MILQTIDPFCNQNQQQQQERRRRDQRRYDHHSRRQHQPRFLVSAPRRNIKLSSLFRVFVLLHFYCFIPSSSLTTAMAMMITTTTASAASKAAMGVLHGKNVLITGGGRGIGRAIALICYRNGANVAITSRTKSELEETLRLATTAVTARAASSTSSNNNDKDNNNNDTTSRNDLSSSCEATTTTTTTVTNDITFGKMTIHVADITNPQQVDAMVQEVINAHCGTSSNNNGSTESGSNDNEETFHGLDILINNAGGAQKPKGAVDTLEAEKLTQLLQINVVSVHTVTNAVINKAMKRINQSNKDNNNINESNPTSTKNNKNRMILNISSKAGKVGLANSSFYVASKFALEGMTSSWAKELKDDNIVVCSMSPGMVDTQSFPKPPNRPGVRTADSIEDAILFALAEPNMDYTGHYLHVDELDKVQEKGLPDTMAWKPIDEPPFQV